MAQTRISGNDGNFAWDTPAATTVNGLFSTYNLAFTRVISDVTAYGDSNGRVVAGIRKATVNATGHLAFDDSDLAPNPDDMTSGAITVTCATGCSFGGTLVPGSVSIAGDKNGDLGITMDGPIDGAFTQTWDETA